MLPYHMSTTTVDMLGIYQLQMQGETISRHCRRYIVKMPYTQLVALM